VCQRREGFENLPPEQQELLIVDVVRKRYRNAKMEHLAAGLREKLVGLNNRDGVYIYGPTGTGKTYALAALAREYISLGYDVKRITYEELCLKIRDTFKPSSKQSEWGFIEPYLDCDKLILEDISTTVSVGRQESDFALRIVLLILDNRSENCLPTLITGNKPPNELENAFDSRIASRLRQGEIIQMVGKDRRS
jgi:DNA replication protein DnaC